jgi:hypothetical protein
MGGTMSSEFLHKPTIIFTECSLYSTGALTGASLRERVAGFLSGQDRLAKACPDSRGDSNEKLLNCS